jgi:acetyltransferase-like isoleucine patch superfamily enzyme
MYQPLHQRSVDFDDHEGFFSRALTKLNSLWVAATYPFAAKGRDLSLHYASEISRNLADRIRLGNRVRIGKHTWLSPDIDDNHEIKITVEDNCRLGARCTISAKNSIHLGRDVVLGCDVLIIDNNHAHEDVSTPISQQGTTPGGSIRVGEGCRIGDGVAIVCDKGELVLGRNCVVAPGAVVTRSFPPNSVLSGNPARAAQKSGAGEAGAEPEFWGGASGTYEASAPRHAGRMSALRKIDPLGWLSRGASKLRTLWLESTYPFDSFGRGAWMHYSCQVSRIGAASISIGEDVGLANDVWLDASAAPGTDSTVLIMEAGSGMQRRGVISARNRIHLMKNAMCGFSVLLMDHSGTMGEVETGRREKVGAIRIEEDCWIGFGAVIVCDEGELVIGKHSVVGANSVVTSSIPPYSVVAGNPAMIVKQYDFAKGKWVLGCIRSKSGPERQDREPALSLEAQTGVLKMADSPAKTSRGAR